MSLINEQIVSAKVTDELARIADPRITVQLKKYLVKPRACLLEWDYGHPHPEFAEAKYPGFIVAEFSESRTGIAFSEYGSGPSYPWILMSLDSPGFGMDSNWFLSIEDAFRASIACDMPPPPGYEVG